MNSSLKEQPTHQYNNGNKYWNTLVNDLTLPYSGNCTAYQFICLVHECMDTTFIDSTVQYKNMSLDMVNAINRILSPLAGWHDLSHKNFFQLYVTVVCGTLTIPVEWLHNRLKIKMNDAILERQLHLFA